MREKELLFQLHNLKSIKPDEQWKKTSREILLTQISAGSGVSNGVEPASADVFGYIKSLLAQPAGVVLIILFFVLGGGFFSLNIAENTKPGDSLYIAKLISEKAQLAITFNENEKAKLGIKFASNRAKEMTQILAEAKFNNSGQEEKAKKLASNFKEELSAVKTRLDKINDAQKNEDNVKSAEIIKEEEKIQIFSANSEKADKGMQIYDSSSKDTEPKNDGSIKAGMPDAAPGTLRQVEGEASGTSTAREILEEAEKLFAEQNYNGTLNKLKEANAIIDELGKGKVKGVDENFNAKATTTENK